MAFYNLGFALSDGLNF